MVIDISPELEQAFRQIAEQWGRDPNELANEVMEHYIHNAKFLAADLEEAEQEADREVLMSHQEVFERLNQRLLKTA